MTALAARDRLLKQFANARAASSMKKSYTKVSSLDAARIATKLQCEASAAFLSGSTGVEPKQKCYVEVSGTYKVAPRYGNRWLKGDDGAELGIDGLDKSQAIRVLQELAKSVAASEFDDAIERQRLAHHSFKQ